MSARLSVNAKTKRELNIRAIKGLDSRASRILDTSSHCVLYKLDLVTKEWHFAEAKGTLFLYTRSSAPKYRLVLLNRLRPENFEVDLEDDMFYEVDESQQFLFIGSRVERKVYAIWFHDVVATKRLSGCLTKVFKKLITEREADNENKEELEELLSPDELFEGLQLDDAPLSGLLLPNMLSTSATLSRGTFEAKIKSKLESRTVIDRLYALYLKR